MWLERIKKKIKKKLFVERRRSILLVFFILLLGVERVVWGYYIVIRKGWVVVVTPFVYLVLIRLAVWLRLPSILREFIGTVVTGLVVIFGFMGAVAVAVVIFGLSWSDVFRILDKFARMVIDEVIDFIRDFIGGWLGIGGAAIVVGVVWGFGRRPNVGDAYLVKPRRAGGLTFRNQRRWLWAANKLRYENEDFAAKFLKAKQRATVASLKDFIGTETSFGDERHFFLNQVTTGVSKRAFLSHEHWLRKVRRLYDAGHGVGHARWKRPPLHYSTWVTKKLGRKGVAADHRNRFIAAGTRGRRGTLTCMKGKRVLWELLNAHKLAGTNGVLGVLHSLVGKKQMQAYHSLLRTHKRELCKVYAVRLPNKFLKRNIKPFAHYFKYDASVSFSAGERRFWRPKAVSRLIEKAWGGARRFRIRPKFPRDVADPRRKRTKAGWISRWYKARYTFNDVCWFVKYPDLVGKNKDAGVYLKGVAFKDTLRRFTGSGANRSSYIIVDKGPQVKAYLRSVYKKWIPIFSASPEQAYLWELAEKTATKVFSAAAVFSILARSFISAAGVWARLVVFYQLFIITYAYIKFFDEVGADWGRWEKFRNVRFSNHSGFWAAFALVVWIGVVISGVVFIWYTFYAGVHSFLKIEFERTVLEVLLGTGLSALTYKRFIRKPLKRFLRDGGRGRIGLVFGTRVMWLYSRAIFVLKLFLVGLFAVFLWMWFQGYKFAKKSKGAYYWETRLKQVYWDFRRFIDFNGVVDPARLPIRMKRRKDDVKDTLKGRKNGYLRLGHWCRHPESRVYSFLGRKRRKRVLRVDGIRPSTHFKGPKIDPFRRVDQRSWQEGRAVLRVKNATSTLELGWRIVLDWLGKKFDFEEGVLKSIEYFKFDDFTRIYIKKQFFKNRVTKEEDQLWDSEIERVARSWGKPSLRRRESKAIKNYTDAEQFVQGQYRARKSVLRRAKEGGTEKLNLKELDWIVE